jgi:parvulin-like peptidyl-prolyl isomerase
MKGTIVLCLTVWTVIVSVLAGGCQRYQKFQSWRSMKLSEENEKQAAATTRPVTFSEEPEPRVSETRAPAKISGTSAGPRRELDLNPHVARPRGSIEAAVLTVNRDYLTADEVLRRAQPQLEATALTYGEDVYKDRAEEILSSTIRDLISETLLYQEIAARITEDENPAVEKAVEKEISNYTTLEAGGSRVLLEKMLAERGVTMDDLKKQLRKQIVTQQYLREKMKPKVIVTRDDLWEYYEAHRGEFSEPAGIRLFLIELDAAKFLPKDLEWSYTREENRRAAQAKAQRQVKVILARLEKGEDFSKLAREFSTGLSGTMGGDMGWISRGSYRLKALEDTAFNLNVGRIGGPIVIGSKTFLLKVADYRPEKTQTFGQAQDQIRAILERECYRRLVMEHLRDLMEKAQVGTVETFYEAVYSRLPAYESWKKKGKTKVVTGIEP